MQLTTVKHKIKCEMGTCKNNATHSIKMDRVWIRSQIHICDDCLHELYDIVAQVIVPKSIETAKRKGGK